MTGEYIIQHGYQSLLEKLKLFVENNCEEAKEVEIKPAPYSSRPRSVSFTYPFNGGKRGKVDLLVSPHWTGDQTTISEPSVFYRFLTTIPRTKRSMYIPATSYKQQAQNAYKLFITHMGPSCILFKTHLCMQVLPLCCKVAERICKPCCEVYSTRQRVTGIYLLVTKM